MDNKENILHLRSIDKEFPSKNSKISILKNAEFKINKGDTIAVVGASGIGKSTLLNIIGTLDKPDNGELFFKGQNVLKLKEPELAMFRNINIGFVFQFHHLLLGFSALENVMIPCMIHSSMIKHADRINKNGIKDMAFEMLERVGLKDRISSRVEELSGGEQQRVALARALVNRPDLLLADEPTGNLDKDNSRGVHELIAQFNKEFGMTIVVVTHNDEFAELMGRTVTITEGKIVEV